MKHLPAQRHGAIEQVFEDIWCVKGGSKLPLRLPVRLSKTMTVVRDPETTELTLINAMRLSESGLVELESLGRIANVMTLGSFHGKDDGFFRDVFGAKIYALEGHAYTREIRAEAGPSAAYLEPDVRLGENSPLPVRDRSLKLFQSSRLPEALLVMDRDGGILVAADALHNTPAPDEFVSWLARLVMNRAGFSVAYNVGPGWPRSCSPTVEDLRTILNLEFEHVLPGHGNPVIGDAKAKYRPTLEGELKGARS
jgi:hypothetical protein